MAAPIMVRCPVCELVQELPAVGRAGKRWCSGRWCGSDLPERPRVDLEAPITADTIAPLVHDATAAVRAISARTTTDQDLAAAAAAATASTDRAFAAGIEAGKRRAIGVVDGLIAAYGDDDPEVAALVTLLRVTRAAIIAEVR